MDIGCCWCQKPTNATLLCDHVIGWIAEIDSTGEHPRLVKREAVTCDLPMCEAHATTIGRSFVCSGIGTEDATADIESIDRCPLHAGRRDDGAPMLTDIGIRAARDRLRFEAALRSGVITGGKS